jgi:hypothetical protein
MMAKALKSFKDAGDYDAPIREWEAKPVASQTYANLKVVMCAEFAKLNRQDATTARATGHASVNNVVKEMAQATEELVAELTKKHTKQVETLIKANSDAIEKLTAAILANKPAAASGATDAAKAAKASARKAKWAEKKLSTPVCPHCNRRHPNIELCWELPANAATRPAGWKSKST